MRFSLALGLLPLLTGCMSSQMIVGNPFDCGCDMPPATLTVALNARIPAESDAMGIDYLNGSLQSAGWNWVQARDDAGGMRTMLADPNGQLCDPVTSFAEGQLSVRIACSQVVESVQDRNLAALQYSAEALDRVCARLVDQTAMYQCNVNKTPR